MRDRHSDNYFDYKVRCSLKCYISDSLSGGCVQIQCCFVLMGTKYHTII